MVLSANASRASVTRPRCSTSARSSSSSVSACPRATHVAPRKMLEPRIVTRSPSVSSSKSGAPGASIRRTPPRTSWSGPGFGKRPVCDGETLTTTGAPDSTSSSADTRSRSAWSTIAISPGRSRFTRSFVRRSSRAVAVSSTNGRVTVAMAWDVTGRGRGIPARRACAGARRGARRRRAGRCGCASGRRRPCRR